MATTPTQARTTRSRSASANTTIGDFPPSSRVVGTRRSPASAATTRPVATEPVKVTRRTSGWATSGVPAAGPVPVTTLNRPSGRPASLSTRARCTVAGEVNSDGFTTTALPAARAGAPPRHAWFCG